MAAPTKPLVPWSLGLLSLGYNAAGHSQTNLAALIHGVSGVFVYFEGRETIQGN